MTFYQSNSWHVHEDIFSHVNADDTRYRISASGSSSMSTSSSNAEELETSADTQPLRDFNGRKKKSNNQQRVQGKYYHVPHKEKPPQVVAKRNARERRRVQAVNTAFVRLRKAVPFDNSRGKRISKVKTLQYAIDYIQRLQDLLNGYTDGQNMQYCYDFCHNSGTQQVPYEYSLESDDGIWS